MVLYFFTFVRFFPVCMTVDLPPKTIPLCLHGIEPVSHIEHVFCVLELSREDIKEKPTINWGEV